jgi:hypothetical protein
MDSISASEADFMKSRLGMAVEHAASMRPHAMTAMTRVMISPLGPHRAVLPEPFSGGAADAR